MADRPSRRRTWFTFGVLAIAVAAVVGIVVASGNGGSSRAKTSTGPITFAAVATATRGTVQVTIESRYAMSVTQNGVVDFDHHTLEFSTRVSGWDGMSLIGTMLFDGRSAYVSINSMIDAMEHQHDSSGFTSGLIRRLRATHAHWIEQSPKFGPSKASPVENAVLDPAHILNGLQRAGITPRAVGHDRIGGIDTTHYRAQVSQRLISSDPATPTSTVPLDLWVDARDRLVRLVLVTTAPDRETDTLTFSDYGVPAPIAKPAPTDVISFDQYMQIMDAVTPATTR